LDDIPEIQEAHEEFLVLKDFGLDADGNLLTPDPTPQIMQGREGDLVLVNGELNPTFPLPKEWFTTNAVFERFGGPLLSAPA
jgi:FtsP/CotA-like multicopper oxidase with cupredoxin domain